MQKSGYVNNLVDMREQLRRNYRNPEDAPATAAPASPAPETLEKENRFDIEAKRDARDLEGRLLSALATAKNEKNLLEFRQKELSGRIEKLESLMAEMATLDYSETGGYRTQVDQLRYRFFEIDVESGETQLNVAEKSTPGVFAGTTWIISIAIILGALIIAGAFLLCF